MLLEINWKVHIYVDYRHNWHERRQTRLIRERFSNLFNYRTYPFPRDNKENKVIFLKKFHWTSRKSAGEFRVQMAV